MRYSSAWLYAAGAPAFALAGLVACGGQLGSGDLSDSDAGSGGSDGTCGAACDLDAGHPARGSNDASSNPTSDATTAETSTAADANDASDAGTASDGPVPTVHEVCRATWAQLDPDPRTDANVQVAVDPSGNMYVAEQWVSNPGLSIVKLDAACHVLWTRQLRSPADAGDGLVRAQLTVAADSSVVLAGEFNGTIDFGNGPITAPDDGIGHAFVERLAPDGGFVFVIVYGGGIPTILSPDLGGVTSLHFFDYDAYACAQAGGCVDGGADGGAQDGGAIFGSFVQLDSAGHEVARHPSPLPLADSLMPYVDDPAVFGGLDPEGGVWILQNYNTVTRYTENGDALWQQPASGIQLALTPSGGVVFGTQGTPQGTTETLRALDFDGGIRWTQSTMMEPSVAYPSFLAVGPGESLYVGGAAFPCPQAPSGGVAVQVFDPQGQLLGVRIAPERLTIGYMGFGVDPSGNAVLAGSLNDDDAGYNFVLVKLGP
jgi:hypothetical protein